MSGSEKKVGPPGQPALPEATLQAKYLDYCSARVAEALLRMTPDEMYLLARTGEGEDSSEGRTSLSYTELVRLATGRITERLALPDFGAWAREYRQDPQRFEDDLLGFGTADSGTADSGTLDSDTADSDSADSDSADSGTADDSSSQVH